MEPNPYESPRSAYAFPGTEATKDDDGPGAAAWFVFAFGLAGAIVIATLTIIASQ